ncbi:MAG TPA: YfiR family protein [Stellaceae bacterium]|nr:YfiR family protein [Stellaceae bacterium]
MNLTRPALIGAGIGVALALWCCPFATAFGQNLAAALKATYLVKFGSFVDWPPTAFASPSSPLDLCVVGDHPFGDLLDRAAAGQRVNGHPIEIRRLSSITQNSNCDILYASGASAEAALAAARYQPILTVTDLPASAPQKGIINFTIRDDRVRFEIDDRNARQDGLHISSQLLTLAVNKQP